MPKLLASDSWIVVAPSTAYVVDSNSVTYNRKAAKRMPREAAVAMAKAGIDRGVAYHAEPYLRDKFDRYLHLCQLAVTKYANNGKITLSRRGFPSRYKLVTDYLFRRYVLGSRLPSGYRDIVN